MQFDITFAIREVGPLEPAFLASLLVGVLVARLITRPLRYLHDSLTESRRRQIYVPLLWGTAGLLLLLGEVILADFLYSLSHPRVMLGAGFVWPAYLIPLVILFVGGARRRPSRRAGGFRQAERSAPERRAVEQGDEADEA